MGKYNVIAITGVNFACKRNIIAIYPGTTSAKAKKNLIDQNRVIAMTGCKGCQWIFSRVGDVDSDIAGCCCTVKHKICIMAHGAECYIA